MGKNARIVITGGGTAGHTNPGIAVAQALVAAGVDRDDVHFVGGRRGNEGMLVADAGFSIDLLPGRGIERRVSVASIGAVFALVAGLAKGFWYVLRRRPRVVLCLGGYASFAVSLAAILLRVPLVVTEQNARASAVNRLMGRFARVCALPFPDTDLPNGELTGNPSLASVVDSVAAGDRASARQALGLTEQATTGDERERVVLAVWSGSLGATRVNDAVRGLATRWADRGDLAIRHVVGRRDWDRFKEPPPEVASGALVYQLVEYEDRMPLLLIAADLAVCRSGASTVSELSIAGLPAVLVPLPIAPRDHQRANAKELVDVGGAIVVADGDLDADALVGLLGPLVDDARERERMASAASSVARPEAASLVAELVMEHGGIQPTGSRPAALSTRTASAEVNEGANDVDQP